MREILRMRNAVSSKIFDVPMPMMCKRLQPDQRLGRARGGQRRQQGMPPYRE